MAQAEAKYGPSGLGMVRFEDLIPAGTKYGTGENGAADLTYRDGNTLWVWEVKQAMTIPWLYYRPPAEAYGGWDVQNYIYKMKKNPAYSQYDIRPGYNIDGPLVGPGAKPGEFLELNDSSLWPNGVVVYNTFYLPRIKNPGGSPSDDNTVKVPDPATVGKVAGAGLGGGAVLWWLGKLASPACGPAAPACALAF